MPAGNKKRYGQIKRNKKTENLTPRRLTVREIEEELGFDKVKPIAVSPSDETDMKKKDDYFQTWYEEELRAYYKKQKNKKS